MKTAILSLCLCMVLISSCSKDDETVQEVTEKSLAPAKTYLGMLLTDTEAGGYKLSIDKFGITTLTIKLGNDSFNLTSDMPLRNGESITLTDGSNSVETSVNNFGREPKLKFTLPGYADFADSNFELKKEGALRLYTGFQQSSFFPGMVDESSVNLLILSDDGTWDGLDRIDFNVFAPQLVGRILSSKGTYIEKDDILEFLVVENMFANKFIFKIEGDKFILINDQFGREIEFEKLTI